MENNLTTKNFWEKFWGINKNNNQKIKIEEINDIPFFKIFKRYLSKKNFSEKALEIGCFPGTLLAYLCKTFEYFPEGIDFIDNGEKMFFEILKASGLKKYRFYKKDFTKWKTKKKYGLVCSFGFIEHFKNPKEIVKKHIDLLEKNGKLIIEVPNFNGLRYFIAKYSDKETLGKHNMKVMNLNFYRDIADKYNLKINYLRYYGKFEYTWVNYKPSILQKLIYYPFKILSKLTFNYPFKNKLLSSWILFIAEKRN